MQGMDDKLEVTILKNVCVSLNIQITSDDAKLLQLDPPLPQTLNAPTRVMFRHDPLPIPEPSVLQNRPT